jgi:hypothetical protein
MLTKCVYIYTHMLKIFWGEHTNLGAPPCEVQDILGE